MKTVKRIIAIFTVFFIFFLPIFLMPKNEIKRTRESEKKEFIKLDFQNVENTKLTSKRKTYNSKIILSESIRNSQSLPLKSPPIPLITTSELSEKIRRLSILQTAEKITKMTTQKVIENVPQKSTEISTQITKISDTFELNEVDEKPQILKNSPPRFPYRARLHNIKGSVTVRFNILQNGTTSEIIKIAEDPSDYQLFNAVEEALKYWTFSPAKKDGKAVIVSREITFSFEIN